MKYTEEKKKRGNTTIFLRGLNKVFCWKLQNMSREEGRSVYQLKRREYYNKYADNSPKNVNSLNRFK